MSRWFRSMILLLISSAVLLTASVALAQAPVAQLAGGCSVGSGYGFGYTYLTSLTVTRTSCSNGKRVVKHHGHVRGWHCTKKRLASSPVQYQDRETCKSGSRRVVWTFTQNT